jgi:hypothetical protein
VKSYGPPDDDIVQQPELEQKKGGTFQYSLTTSDNKCYVHHKLSQKVPSANMQHALVWEAARVQDTDNFYIHFLGHDSKIDVQLIRISKN